MLLGASAACAACGGSKGAAPRVIAWQAASLPAPTGGARAEPDAIASGPPWLIGGAVQVPGQAEPVPAVWSSADGRIWRARIMKPTTPDGVHTRILSVAARGSVQVALGNRPSPLHGNARPTVWRATGDGPFTEISTTRELFGGPNLISFGAVTAGAQGFLVAGSWDTPAGVSATLWFSANGLTWSRIDSPAQFEPAAGELLQATDAASAGEGAVLVGRGIGGSGGGAGALRPLAWQAAAPAGPWARIGLGPGGQLGAVDVVVGAGGRAIAAGWTGAPPRLSVWTRSPSGNWSAVPLPGHPAAPAGGKDVGGIGLAAGGGRVLLSVASVQTPALWTTSAASLDWSRLALPPGEAGAAELPIAADGHALVLLAPVTASVWVAGLSVPGR